MSRLSEAGLPREDVEKAVRSNAYSHEAACYEMLFSQAQNEKTHRGGSSRSGSSSSSAREAKEGGNNGNASSNNGGLEGLLAV